MGHEKNLSQMGECQNLIYESIGGAVINMISVSFSCVKIIWLLGEGGKGGG